MKKNLSQVLRKAYRMGKIICKWCVIQKYIKNAHNLIIKRQPSKNWAKLLHRLLSQEDLKWPRRTWNVVLFNTVSNCKNANQGNCGKRTLSSKASWVTSCLKNHHNQPNNDKPGTLPLSWLFKKKKTGFGQGCLETGTLIHCW